MQSKRVKFSAAAAAAAWERVESQSEPGEFYYRNTATGETTWEKPEDCAESSSSEARGPFRLGSAVIVEPPRSAASSIAIRGAAGIVKSCSDGFAEISMTLDSQAGVTKRVPTSWLKRLTKGGAKLLLHSDDTCLGSLERTLLDAPQHRAPAFQRRYCWDDEQWKRLWHDVVSLAQHEPTAQRDHHVGRLVVSPPRGSGDRLVLDGQQRLTTCTVLLASLRDRCRALGDDAETQRLAALVREPLSGNARMVPTLDDRADYERAIGESDGEAVDEAAAGETDREMDGKARLVRARATFDGLCAALQDAPSARRVSQALRERLMCTVWVLDDADLTVVFENLSMKGRVTLDGGPPSEILGVSMSPVDLIRNFCLEHFGPDEDKMRDVHAQHWSPLEARAVAAAPAGASVSEALSTALLGFLARHSSEPELYPAFLDWWRHGAPDGVVDQAAAMQRLRELESVV